MTRATAVVGERRPDGGIEFVEPEIGGDEAETAVEADHAGTDENAVDVNDMGCLLGGAPSGSRRRSAIPAVITQ